VCSIGEINYIIPTFSSLTTSIINRTINLTRQQAATPHMALEFIPPNERAKMRESEIKMTVTKYEASHEQRV